MKDPHTPEAPPSPLPFVICPHCSGMVLQFISPTNTSDIDICAFVGKTGNQELKFVFHMQMEI